MNESKDQVLTTDEAIKYLKISKPTYFKCIRVGKINAIKVGSGWRVLQSELNKFLKSGKVASERGTNWRNGHLLRDAKLNE